MSCEHLICAQCAGPVVEGRCPACREAKSHVHHTQPSLSVPLVIIALTVLVALMLALGLIH